MTDKTRELLEGSIGYLAAFMVAVVYVAVGMLVPGINDKSLLDMLREGVVGFALGVSMNFCLNLQGILRGKRSTKMQETATEHSNAVEAIEPYIHRLDVWCEQQNSAALRAERTRILAAAAMRYTDYFAEDGTPVEVDFSCLAPDVRKERQRAMRKARRLRLTPISAATLTGDGGRPDDPFYFGETTEEYQAHTNLKDVFSKLIIAAAFGYFSVDMMLNFDIAALIWRALYVALLFSLGVAKLLRSYLFVVDTYRGNVKKRINYLQSFLNWAKATPEKEVHNGITRLHAGAIQNRQRAGTGKEEAGGHQRGEPNGAEAAKIPASGDRARGTAGVQSGPFGNRVNQS